MYDPVDVSENFSLKKASGLIGGGGGPDLGPPVFFDCFKHSYFDQPN